MLRWRSLSYQRLNDNPRFTFSSPFQFKEITFDKAYFIRFSKENAKPKTAINEGDSDNESQNIDSKPKYHKIIFPAPNAYSPKNDDSKYIYSLRNREKFGTILPHELGPGPDHYKEYKPISIGYSGLHRSFGGSRKEVQSKLYLGNDPGKYDPKEVIGYRSEKLISTEKYLKPMLQ